jgi:hypothetical protein
MSQRDRGEFLSWTPHAASLPERIVGELQVHHQKLELRMRAERVEQPFAANRVESEPSLEFASRVRCVEEL